MSSDSINAGLNASIVQWTARAIMQGLQLAYSYYVADKQFALAEKYSDRAQQALDSQLAWTSGDQSRWYGQIAPCFDNMIAEVCAMPVHVADYHGEAAKALTVVRQQAARTRRQISECASIHCVGMTCHTEAELSYKEAALSTSAIQMAMRREEIDTERKNAQRLALKSQVIAMGRQNFDGSNRSAGQLAGMYGQLASEAGKALGSSMQAIGYNAAALGRTLGGDDAPWKNNAKTADPRSSVNYENEMDKGWQPPAPANAQDLSTNPNALDYGANPYGGAEGVNSGETGATQGGDWWDLGGYSQGGNTNGGNGGSGDGGINGFF